MYSCKNIYKIKAVETTYRIIELSGNKYAVELLTSGRDAHDELQEMRDYADEGAAVSITTEIPDGAQLITRDYL